MITPKQKVSDIEFLRVIRNYVLENTWAPSIEDIIKRTSIHSKATVFQRLNLLEEQGYIERLHGQPRAIRLTSKGSEMVLGSMIMHTFNLAPVQQQRPRATRFGRGIRLYDPKPVKQFKKAIAEEAALTYRGEPLTGSLGVSVIFYRPVQKSLSGAEKRRRIDGQHLPVVKPDLDNYVKSFLDALHGIYWQDDALITDLTASKRYSERPCITIEVSEV